MFLPLLLDQLLEKNKIPVGAWIEWLRNSSIGFQETEILVMHAILFGILVALDRDADAVRIIMKLVDLILVWANPSDLKMIL